VVPATSTATPSATAPSGSTPASTEVAVGGSQPGIPITATELQTPAIHTVEPGDTLSVLGQEYGVSAQLIAAANDLADADVISQGEQLFIPTPDGHLPAEAPMAAVYVVVPGDSMSTIAPQFGLSVETLMSFNDISNPDLIHVGEVIKIPKSGLTASS
jgi:LysM repeat protein